ncbi:prolyl aminopeptidase [Endozoicomonas sp. Mp262]|uniref:prolyl aminopeptidase n=1 Tax=Endozoicomonas sp. Mp262 TaxID=2919499 RepID=UPI0021DABA3F
MHTLYPAIKPYATHRLQVDAIHDIYLEECGTPDGIPVLFVHGGPGAGSSEQDRRFFDPERYRIILFDQRGCNRSKPHAELQNNSTAELVTDIETIREFLKIERWILFGGSWGSTLSLVYAQQHPKTVMAMVLRGIFLGREQDFQWLYQSGANRIFPDNWSHFIELIPEAEQDNMVEAYHKRLFGEDELARMNAAKHWSAWEGGIATLRPNQDVMDHFSDPHLALSLSRIECHYFKHKAWLQDKPILSRMKMIARIPAVVIHGRYDMICPLDNATALVEQWPEAELQVIRDAGHVAIEPGIIDALVRATDQFAQKFEKP